LSRCAIAARFPFPARLFNPIKTCRASDRWRIILETYERNADHIDPVAEEFVRDLDDVIAMTRWAEG
jgi:hypothetical protein